MKTLADFLAEGQDNNIYAVANYIEQHVKDNWQAVLTEHEADLLRVYERAGEPSYGMYAQKLLRPVQQQLKEAGFVSEPGYPGTLTTSREWGPSEQRQRWMWCVLSSADGAELGTLVIKLFHDHSQFRVPHAPEIFAVEATDEDVILAKLSEISAPFASAED